MRERAKELRRGMTPEEEALWRWLRGNRFYGLHFRRQQVVGGFIVDFYCHGVGVVIEVDGGIHGEQVEQDAVRDAYVRRGDEAASRADAQIAEAGAQSSAVLGTPGVR